MDVTSNDFLEPPPWTLHIPVGWESQRGAFAGVAVFIVASLLSEGALLLVFAELGQGNDDWLIGGFWWPREKLNLHSVRATFHC